MRCQNVMYRIPSRGWKVKFATCSFAQPRLKHFGHIIDKMEAATDPAKIKAIQEAPLSTYVSYLRSFLGLVSYHRRYIPSFAEASTALHEAMSPNEK